MKRALPTFLALVLVWGLIVTANPAHAEGPPAKVALLDSKMGKPPLRYVGASLEIENKRDKMRWFVIRTNGNQALADKRTFKSSSVGVPFGGEGYVVGRKRAVVIHHHGPNSNDSFIAIALPPRSTVTFERFVIWAWAPVSEFEIWEVRSIRVNGKTRLEKWLPYKAICDAGVIVPPRQDKKNLDWDSTTHSERTDYPKQKVSSVTLDVVGKWRMPLKMPGE